MLKYCRDQARDELWLMMGGGAAVGVAGAVKAFGEAAIAYFENMYPDKIYSSD